MIVMLIALSVLGYTACGVVTTRIGRRFYPDIFNQNGREDDVPAGLSFLMWWGILIVWFIHAIWSGAKWLCLTEVKLSKRSRLDYVKTATIEKEIFPELPTAYRTAPPGVAYQDVWVRDDDG
jgi:hypothetical protein